MFVRHFENILAIVETDNMALVRSYDFTFNTERVGRFLICFKKTCFITNCIFI